MRKRCAGLVLAAGLLGFVSTAYAGVPGDVNGDGVANINDAVLVARYSSGLSVPTLTHPENGDVTGDGQMNIVDAMRIARYSTGLDELACDGKDTDGDGSIDEGCPDAYGFFVFADVQPRSGDNTAGLSRAVSKMKELNDGASAKAVAAFSVGDLTFDLTADRDWDALHDAPLSSLFALKPPNQLSNPTDTVPYFPVLGNHDEITVWNRHVGVQGLTDSVAQGANYSLTYRNAAFAVLDSVRATSATQIKDQANAVAPALASEAASFKFMFFHKPVYSCLTRHAGNAGFGSGLRWVQLAEDQNVDVIFNGHTHEYTRSQPLKGGKPAAEGVVQVEVGTVSNALPGPEVVDVNTEISTTGTVAGPNGSDVSRTDTYNCWTEDTLPSGSSATPNLVVANPQEEHVFCHVQIHTCRADIQCYSVERLGTSDELVDSWAIDKCSP